MHNTYDEGIHVPRVFRDEGGGESQLQDSTKVEAIHGGDRIM
jgi:hypothetical protein